MGSRFAAVGVGEVVTDVACLRRFARFYSFLRVADPKAQPIEIMCQGRPTRVLQVFSDAEDVRIGLGILWGYWAVIRTICIHAPSRRSG